MDDEKTKSPADQMNSALFLNPETIGDSEQTPLLDRARKNVAETDYAEEAARDEEFRRRKNEDG